MGSSAHADDIRVVGPFDDAVSWLGACINSFCNTNLLKLNGNKTEAVTFSMGNPPYTTIQLASNTITPQPQIKCLGIWWRHDMSPCISVEENISKARRAFFATGSLGSFHGKLNPLSGCSIFETFVTPVLLYGSETWILSPALMKKLEKFQAEIGRRILCLTRFHADLAPIIGLHLPSMKVRILLRKLKFLARLLSTTNNTQSARTFRTLAVENVYGISLVQQCLWLEHTLNTPPIVHQCLTNPDSAISLVNENRNNILRQDWADTVKLAKSHTSLKYVVSNDDIALCWSRTLP